LFPLPPLNEQKRIAAKVDELMRLCDDLGEQIRQSKEESKRLMQAVLQEAFEGKYSEGPDQEVSAA
jgi:type I restriction enzyme S subunit